MGRNTSPRREPHHQAHRPEHPRTRHTAARVEDRLNKLLAVHLGRRGWTPRVLGYASYGGEGWVRVLGRVLATRPPEHHDSDPGSPVPEGPYDPVSLRDWVGPYDRDQLKERALTALRGWRAFISAPVEGVAVWVTVGERTHRLVSARGGYLDAQLPSDLPPGVHDISFSTAPPGEADPDERAGAPSTARVTVIGSDQRFGVVSDIDDTVMVTSLPRPLIAAWNTFVLHEQARSPVPGMADLLTAAAEAYPDTPVLYLSTGAWNAAPTITRFMLRHGYPAGPLLLTDWGPTNTGWFRSGQEHKRAALRRLAEELPQVQWLLVGDDGQHDPEIYGEFAREHPEHVRAVAIRQLTAAEQVLSHVLPVPVPGSARPGRVAAVPEVRAPDGVGLAHQLRQASVPLARQVWLPPEPTHHP
ncbi:Phosphatidate phosphatase APP1 [Quadrisphaera granulorum]|uniref:Phosphatidate phosphatase APP1 n=2 Tax=Quadrisphaera granulorum TaxID=317664 RepID=A0A316AB69_9ACTN|nr:phosphatidate phosphatase APP1 [Quadrisphaera granulorum]SZE96031.1 Phosphatidate phosphatase APP1 [Quadrisphaera granulorum]